jgi:hypothetical protein
MCYGMKTRSRLGNYLTGGQVQVSAGDRDWCLQGTGPGFCCGTRPGVCCGTEKGSVGAHDRGVCRGTGLPAVYAFVVGERTRLLL